ncbi:hypothetical protein [Rhodophyticola porphyridii]|uniref:hypothetical protein n=1 Tax=Rhodophyticola porphyridii TaxID=1852017 RepID=UPI0011C49F4F|nr:hypothetical protein [Rhodophyticola porphyridii]
MRGLAARVAKLESRNRPPVRVRSSVVEYDAETGAIISSIPPRGTKVMMVPCFKDWANSLIEQQRQLIASAGINEETQAEKAPIQ